MGRFLDLNSTIGIFMVYGIMLAISVAAFVLEVLSACPLVTLLDMAVLALPSDQVQEEGGSPSRGGIQSRGNSQNPFHDRQQ